MEDEREALEAIFDTDFEAAEDAQGRQRWRIAMPDKGLTFVVTLPAEYPSEAAPIPSLEFEHWPAGGDAFAQRMAKELPGLWEAGEACVYQWVEHLKEALEEADLGSPACKLVAKADEPVEQEQAAEFGSVTVQLPAGTCANGELEDSLASSGFSDYGPGVFSHGDRGVAVEVSATDLRITVDGIDAEDLADWASMQLAENVETFGAQLLQWVTAQRAAEPGFLDEGDAVQGGLDFLPSAAEVAAKQDRVLLIYTWGKALRKSAPADSECNFNAGILNGRGGGADLRTMNGLSDEVQNNVACCGLFPRWVSMVCAKVEHSDLHAISINCTKGRHRSVAAAEIIKKLYYPQAVVRHLTIS